MTREDFVSAGIAWNGSSVGWQGALSRALGVNSRTIRRAVAEGPSDNLARALLDLIDDSIPAYPVRSERNENKQFRKKREALEFSNPIEKPAKNISKKIRICYKKSTVEKFSPKIHIDTGS